MKKLFLFNYLLLFFILACQAQTNNMETDDKKALPCQIIYKIDVNVKSKRIDRNEAPLWKFALVNICKPANSPEQQRQVISIEWLGEKSFRELIEVEKIFETEEEAYEYAKMNHVPMAYFQDNANRVDYVFDLRENGILPSDIKMDLVILEIEKRLPEDWELVQKDQGTITLQAKFKVWELLENKINAPVNRNTKEEEMARIKKYGKEVSPQITFSLHQPWRKEELKAVYSSTGNIADNPLDKFYRNTQYFGLKAISYNGIEDDMHTASYPDKKTKTYHIYELIKTLLEPVNITGKTQNAKMGACIINDQDEIYFVENWMQWEDKFLNKRIGIQGLLVTKNLDQSLKNEKGEYSAGAEGTFNYIVKVELPKVRESTSMVVVFKKEISKENTSKIMEGTGYYFQEGMDSSKGKAYFYQTGEKYHLFFPSEEEKIQFIEQYKTKPEIYEIYQPNWSITKD